MDHLAALEGLDVRVDSAGTGAWHVGERPDPRSTAVAHANGIRLEGRARKVEDADFHAFDYVIAMDRSNLSDLERMHRATDGSARLHLLREFDPAAEGDLDVPDPYYGGPGGFEEVFDMVERSCRVLLDHVRDPGNEGG